VHLGQFLHSVFSNTIQSITHPMQTHAMNQTNQKMNQTIQTVRPSAAQKAALQPMHFPTPGVDAATRQAHQAYLYPAHNSPIPVHVAPSFDFQVQQPNNGYQQTLNPQASMGTAGAIQGNFRNPQLTRNTHAFQHPQQIPVQHLNALYRNMFGDY
jgi:hypothetical protein